MACYECRRRRIKCDGTRPSCGTCARLQKICEYAASEQRRGPKRRSVRALEERLAAVEAQLLTQQSLDLDVELDLLEPDIEGAAARLPADKDGSSHGPMNVDFAELSSPFPENSLSGTNTSATPSHSESPAIDNSITDTNAFPKVEEIRRLNELFFECVYPHIPLVHPRRHDPLTILDGEDPPLLCLRYAMWALAARHSLDYKGHSRMFYRNARMHLQHDEMQDDNLGFLSLTHAQTWALVGMYEVREGFPARAYMSNQRAISLLQVMDLDKLDESPLALKIQNNKHSSKDIIDHEERVRTFHYLLISDRWISSGTGKVKTIRNEEVKHYPAIPTPVLKLQVKTSLPMSEVAFSLGINETRQKLADVLSGTIAYNAPPLTLGVITACLNADCVAHLCTAKNIRDYSDEQKFWARHHELDQALQTAVSKIPPHLRIEVSDNPYVVFTAMCIAEFTVSISHGAMNVAKQTSLEASIVEHYRHRARAAAKEIVRIMRQYQDMDIKRMNEYIPSALYMASTVYIEDIVCGYEVEAALETINFLLSAMRQFVDFCKVCSVFLARLAQDLRTIDFEADLHPEETKRVTWRASDADGADVDNLGPLFQQSPAYVER